MENCRAYCTEEKHSFQESEFQIIAMKTVKYNINIIIIVNIINGNSETVKF